MNWRIILQGKKYYSIQRYVEDNFLWMKRSYWVTYDPYYASLDDAKEALAERKIKTLIAEVVYSE